jgi:dihydroceramide fatty acyl 2-hydroxylase
MVNMGPSEGCSQRGGGACSSSNSDAADGLPDCGACAGSGRGQPFKVDRAAPVVFQVGRLGAHYWAWVNQPEPGMPRFFASSLAEACSKTPWWVVPLVWLPLFVAVQAYCACVLAVCAGALAGWGALGVVAWQGLEYLIHRFVFHADLTSYWGITLHFLFHGCHHKYPMDGQRLVFPPLPASALVAAVYGALTACLPPPCALPLFAGMGYGYVAYDCLHYAIHHSRADGGRGCLRLPLLRDLRRRHMHHHYRDHGSGYGISSSLYDVLLGTSPLPETQLTS